MASHPDLLLERARDFPHGARRQPAPRPPDGGASFLEGAYACYSFSFSPYFPGWLIRSSMIIGPGHGVGSVAYSHNMPPLPTRFSGDITFNGRGMQIALHQTVAGDMRIYMALFGPAPPATVLAGMLCGAAVVTPEPEPSAARIILIRLPARARPSMRSTRLSSPRSRLRTIWPWRVCIFPIATRSTGASRNICRRGHATASSRSPRRNIASWSNTSTASTMPALPR